MLFLDKTNKVISWGNFEKFTKNSYLQKTWSKLGPCFHIMITMAVTVPLQSSLRTQCSHPYRAMPYCNTLELARICLLNGRLHIHPTYSSLVPFSSQHKSYHNPFGFSC